MGMLIGPLLVIIIFFSRRFLTNNKITLPDIIVASIPIGYHILFLALVCTYDLSKIYPLLIASLCSLVLAIYFHALPYVEHIYFTLVGEPAPFGADSLPTKGVLSSFEDIGMFTDDEVEKMLLASHKRVARGDL